VHRRYVMLSDNGVMKRVELAPDAGQSSAISQPVPRAMPPQPMMEPQMAPGVVSAPPMMQSAPPDANQQGMQGQPRDPPPEQDNPGQPQMPQNAQPMNGERPVM
jgi:general secretion pathway protein C